MAVASENTHKFSFIASEHVVNKKKKLSVARTFYLSKKLEDKNLGFQNMNPEEKKRLRFPAYSSRITAHHFLD